MSKEEQPTGRFLPQRAAMTGTSMACCAPNICRLHRAGRAEDQPRILIEAARARGEALDHILFHGPPGLGKTTLAHIVANEMNVNIRVTAGPVIERSGDLAAILTNLRAGDILFIDEVHRLGRAVEEILYPAMEDFVLDLVVGKGPGAKNVRLKLPRFTVIGATTRLALLTAPLRARFGAQYRMDFYDEEAIRAIVTRGARAPRGAD
jgi:holliday junction DNA helicase RuvB